MQLHGPVFSWRHNRFSSLKSPKKSKWAGIMAQERAAGEDLAAFAQV